MRKNLYTPGTSVIDVTAPGGIDRLLDFHRETFGTARMEAGGANGEDHGGSGGAGTESALNEYGYPDKTPVAEMPTDQQAAYWKHQARKHEDRVKSMADYETVKAERDQLKQATQTDAEKAIEAAKAEAAEAARAEARKETLPALVKAEFKAAAAGKIPADRLATILDPLDLTKFLDAAGAEVDTDKVQQYVDGLAPDGKKWPDMGQGRRGDTTRTTGVGAGKSLYEERRGAKKTS